jgi:hypothetical protein
MPEAECNCHLWCDRGTKPSDCSLTAIDSQTITWGYPANMDVDSANEGDDVVHRTAYCNTHLIYSYKTPVVIEVDWNKWKQQKRIPVELREVNTHR